MEDIQEDPAPRKGEKLFVVIKWVKDAGWPLALILAFLQAKGCISPEAVDKFKSVIQPTAPVVKEVTPETVQPLSEPVGKMTPEQWANIIAEVIKLVRPEPLPNPPKPPVTPPDGKDDPEVVPPNPEPPTGLLEIVVSDEAGKPITSPSVEAGQLFRVSAKGATGSIGWQPVKHGPVKLSASVDGTEYTGYLTTGQWVDFGLTDFGSKKQLSIRISCNQGPMPPPPVTPDDGQAPAPQPPPVKPGKVSLIVLYDATTITPDTAIVLNALPVWQSFTTDGHDWRFVNTEDDTLLGQRTKKDASGTTIPALLIYDKQSQSKLSSQPLPMTTEELISVVKGYSGES